jgi:hypothetical protein
MRTMLLAIPFHCSLIFMYLFVVLALYHSFGSFGSFGVVGRFTRIG